MRRNTSISGLLLLAAVLALIGGCSNLRSGWQGLSNRSMLNRLAPPLQGTSWIHPKGEVASPAYEGRRTLLFFFVPKSAPAIEVLPRIQALQDRYREERFVVFGVTETDLEKTTFFLEDYPVDFSVLADAHADRIAFGIKKQWEPEVYLVDTYQRVVAEGLTEVAGALQEHFGH
jgi:peroxiredoxin